MNKNIVSASIIVLLLVVGVAFYSIKKTPKNIPITKNENKIKTTANTDSVIVSQKSPKLGTYLTDTNGRTLYVYSLDAKSYSNCVGECLKKWPIYEYDNKTLKDSTDELSRKIQVFKRADNGYQQYNYEGKPLYYSVEDKNPGDTNGNGLDDGKWNIVLISN